MDLVDPGAPPGLVSLSYVVHIGANRQIRKALNESQTFPHLDAGTHAVVVALGIRLAPGVSTWTDLFTDDAILEAKFDESAHPYQGRQALAALARALAGVLRFEQVQVHEVIDATDVRTVIYTSSAIFTRLDLGARYHRSYVSIAQLDGGRIARLREFGSPMQRVL